MLFSINISASSEALSTVLGTSSLTVDFDADAATISVAYEVDGTELSISDISPEDGMFKILVSLRKDKFSLMLMSLSIVRLRTFTFEFSLESLAFCK